MRASRGLCCAGGVLLLASGLLACAEPERPPPRRALAPIEATPAPTATPRPLAYEVVARNAAQRYLEMDTQRERYQPERVALEARDLAAALRAAAARDPSANRQAAEELATALDLLAIAFVEPDRAPTLLAAARARYASFLTQPLRHVVIAVPSVVPGYRLRGERLVTREGRAASEARVEVDPGATAGEILATLLAVLRNARERTGASAVVVYAYWPGDDSSGPFTAGRAVYACGGQRAWLGYPPDCETVQVDVVPDRESPLQRIHQRVPYVPR